jgi:hypothetical protein
VKYHSKTPSNNEYTLKNEEQECKTGTTGGWILVGGRREKGKSDQGLILLMHFIYLYENITMKPAEFVLRKGRRKMRNRNVMMKSPCTTNACL